MSFLIHDFPYTYGPEDRSGHIGVHWNGNLVIWGGFTDVYIEDWDTTIERYHEEDELWMFDIESCTWKDFRTIGVTPLSLSGSCACCVDDSLYLFAGYCSSVSDGGPNSNLYVLNLKTMVWRNVTSIINQNVIPPAGRDKLCCWQHNDLIIYFGGYGIPPSSGDGVQSYGEFVFNTVDDFRDNRGWNNHILILDTTNLKWIQKKIKGHGPSPRAAHAAAKLGTKAFIFGGRFKDRRLNDLHYLDVELWQWSGSITTTAEGCIPEGRTWHSLSPVSDKHLLLFGGFNNEQQPLGDVYILDTEFMQWTNIIPNANITRMWHTACTTLIPGEVVIYGGCESSLLEEPEPLHSRKVIIFRYTPLPLQRLCTDSVLKHGQHHLLDPEVGSFVRSLISPKRFNTDLCKFCFKKKTN